MLSFSLAVISCDTKSSTSGSISTDNISIDLHVSEDQLQKIKQEWKKPTPNYASGALAKYASLVGSAAEGAITTPVNY